MTAHTTTAGWLFGLGAPFAVVLATMAGAAWLAWRAGK